MPSFRPTSWPICGNRGPTDVSDGRRLSATRNTSVTAATSAPVSAGHKPRPVATWIAFAVCVLIAVVYIAPFVIQVSTSFKTEVDATNNPMNLIPNPVTTQAYVKLFNASDYPLWIVNSFIVTLVVTAGRVFFNSLAGYALSRLRFPGRRAVFLAVLAVLSVPGVVLLIPKFLVINQLGIYDSYAGMILPLLVDAAGVFIMKNFFDSVPVAVEEAARIDGAGTFRTFWSIVLPMARPALITLVILSFQGSWNEYSHFIVSAQSPDLYTLTKGVGTLASGALSGGTSSRSSSPRPPS